jgi:SAM-dependent methyltransferase
METTVPEALAAVRDRLLDADGLVRAVGSGRRRGAETRWRRTELRYVDLKGGRHLQVTAYDDTQAFTLNHGPAAAPTAVDEVLAEPFANWHVQSAGEVLQLRITRKGKALLHTAAASGEADRAHDRVKDRMLAPDHPVLRTLGISDEHGRVKPSRQAKYRQVDEFLRVLAHVVDEARDGGQLRTPTAQDPLRVVDLGCGNAYLTFAAAAWLEQRGLPARLVGVDVKDQSRRHNAEVAARVGLAERVEFVVGAIDEVELPQPPDVVLALHACDTATDDALARALGWQAPVVLAAPCCHHDVAAQLRDRGAPEPYAPLVRDGILRERLADTLTDALRATRLRAEGYRVEVVEFVDSRHTPRNTLLRAVRTGPASGAGPDRARDEYAEIVTRWQIRPRLGVLLGDD